MFWNTETQGKRGEIKKKSKGERWKGRAEKPPIDNKETKAVKDPLCNPAPGLSTGLMRFVVKIWQQLIWTGCSHKFQYLTVVYWHSKRLIKVNNYQSVRRWVPAWYNTMFFMGIMFAKQSKRGPCLKTKVNTTFAKELICCNDVWWIAAMTCRISAKKPKKYYNFL